MDIVVKNNIYIFKYSEFWISLDEKKLKFSVKAGLILNELNSILWKKHMGCFIIQSNVIYMSCISVIYINYTNFYTSATV